MSTHNPRRRYDGNSFVLPLHIFTFSFSRRVLIVATISIATLLLASLFVYQVQARTLPQKQSASVAGGVSSDTVYLSASGQAAAEIAAAEASPAKKTPILEVHIANTGLMLLRGARVVSISGTVIRVGMTWDSADFVWMLETNYNTKFTTSKGEKGALKDIEVGDIVTVTGQLTGGDAEPTIDTEFVREQ